MAQNTPNPQSLDQILGDLLSAYMSRTGINDINTGSAIVSFFEVVALAIARSTGDMFQILRDVSVDRAEGEVLRRIATDEGLRELPARVASGTVTVTDSSFLKVATKIYAGAKAPNIGSVQILVSDASAFTPTGSVYIGRGTPNIEGPISYTSIVPIGSYFQINLSTPTTKFHNINESVILAQGGVRNIAVSTSVKAPASGTAADIIFTITQAAVILDGEASVTNVKVSAQEPGSVGNVPIGGIREFISSPFPNATVINESAFSTGRDSETDDQLRIRIKRARLSRGLGTALAVKSSVIGAAPSDEQATVVSDELVQTSSDTVTLFIDDGTGYEAKTAGVGLEFLIDSAIGGETHFQLETGGRQTSVAKAFLLSNLSSPFDIRGTDALAVTVGGITEEHTFQDSDFVAPGGATSYEIVASINANSALNFQAATSESGAKITITAKEESNEWLKVATPTVGRNAADLVGFPSNRVDTLKLYKNKKPLSKDGNTASVISEPQALWSPTIANGDTLILSVDGTANITYTFLDSDFVTEGSHSTVASTNTLESWVNVFNAKLTGITAAIISDQITLTSNRDTSNAAKITIDASSTIVSKGMFTSSQGLTAVGTASDYDLSRNTAQLRLKTPLVIGDQLTVGTSEAQGIVNSAAILGGSLTLSSDAHMWVLANDTASLIINTGAVAATLISVSKVGSNTLRYTSNAPGAFSTVQAGDYAIVWSQELNVANRIDGRVKASSALYFEVEVTAAEYAAAVAEASIALIDGIVIVRTKKVPQKLTVGLGTKNINTIAEELNDQSRDIEFDVINDDIIRAKTKTDSSTGEVFILTADPSGKTLNFTIGARDSSRDSLFAYYESPVEQGDMIEFVHGLATTDASADPIASQIASFDSSLSLSAEGIDPSGAVEYLDRYGSAEDVQPASEYSILKNYLGNTLDIESNNTLKRVRINDRMFISSPLDFGHEDDLVVVVDSDTAQTFQIPFFRKVAANSTLPPSATAFNAYDTDFAPTGAFTTSFPNGFDFSNFKILMRAKNVINPAGAVPEDALLIRSKLWGRSGEKVRLGYSYPTSPSSAIDYVMTLDTNLAIKISLKSGVTIPNSSDSTTEWNITITPNTPVAGTDMVTYTYSGTGTAPVLTGLSGGEYVTISKDSEFNVNNTGTFKVSSVVGFTPTATSFSVPRKNGAAVAETAKANLVPNAIVFFNSDPTTAADINTFINSSFVSNFVESTIVNDGGTSGAGVISESTLDNTGFVTDTIQLVDGINWIDTSTISGSPQFTLKKPLSLSTATGYAFNGGEELRFVPTSMEALVKFINELTVTGYTTVANSKLVKRGRAMELSSKIIGSSGAIQIVGGLANKSSTPVISGSVVIDDSLIQTPIDSSGVISLHDGEWVKVAAANNQAKETNFETGTTIKIDTFVPAFGQSTIKLDGRTETDRYFGRPRTTPSPNARTFKVEKQGIFTCISWDGVSTSPYFSKAANFYVVAPATMEVEKISATNESRYTAVTGTLSFQEISIGDFVTVTGSRYSENDGTFKVTGISLDGKGIRVFNQAAKNEFLEGNYTIVNNGTISGSTFTVNGTPLVAGVDFAVGATASDTANNLYAAISVLPNVETFVAANQVYVSSDAAGTPLTLAYAGSGGTVTAPAYTAYTAATFTSTIGVKEGDEVFVDAPFDVLNRGKFRVVRAYGESIYFVNERSIEEEVTATSPVASFGGNATTAYDITPANGLMRVKWASVGSEPDFGLLYRGQQITIAAPFNAANQGLFTIIRAESKRQEITRFTMPAAAELSPADYFEFNAANDTTEYYVWFKIAGVGVDPAIVGKTGILVNVAALDSAIQVADAVFAAIVGNTDIVTTQLTNTLTVKTALSGDTTPSTAGNITAPNFELERLQDGSNTIIEVVNPSAVSESSVVATTALVATTPALIFFDYEATVTGDAFVVATEFLGRTNKGIWKIVKVRADDTVVVEGNMASIEETSIFGNENQVFVKEEYAYVGYKKIDFITLDPSNISRAYAFFNTASQANKINELGEAQIESVAKLNFPTTVVLGVDGYKYHTGLIAEANRIVYGDSRDNTTYPGVAAAGAEIFIREPLVRRISVAIDVRLETGIPFLQIVEQIRTNVSSLVDSNPIGVSIAISDIVEIVNAIPGVRAVAIRSPQYDPSNDLLRLGPSEKAKIIDPNASILVSKIG